MAPVSADNQAAYGSGAVTRRLQAGSLDRFKGRARGATPGPYRRRHKKGGRYAPLRRQAVAYFSVGSEPSFGAPVPDEPMNSLRPSGKVTSRPLALQIGVQALSFDW